MSRYPCSICGSETDETAVGLVEWRAPVDARRWEALPRCRDRAGCQERVERSGESWPVVEPRHDLAEAQR